MCFFEKKILNCLHFSVVWGFLGGSDSKESSAMQETWIRSLGWEDPLEKGMAPTPGFLPGESHGQRTWRAAVHGVTKSRT